MAYNTSYSNTHYDPFEDDQIDTPTKMPFFTLNLKDKEEVLTWLNNDYESKRNASRNRIAYYRELLSYYKGQQFKNELRDRRNPRAVFNFVIDMVDSRVSKLLLNKAGYILMPHSGEWKDKVNSKAIKKLLDTRLDAIGFDTKILSRKDTLDFLLGTSFTFVEWDKDIGDETKSYKQVGKKKKKVTSKTGDVSLKVLGPDVCFPQLNRYTWEEVDDITTIKWRKIEELKVDYPSIKDDDISDMSESDADYVNIKSNYTENREGEVIVKTFYHRKTKYLPDGALIKYTHDYILEMGPLPYDDGELPCEISTDIDVYQTLWGKPLVDKIMTPQKFHNILSSQVVKNEIAFRPKYAVAKNSLVKGNLSDDSTIFEYKGGIPPKVLQPNPTSPEVFKFRDELKSWIGETSNVHPISRGEQPAGITAASALRLLDEQEEQVQAKTVVKREDHIRRILKKMINRFGQYYPASPDRMIRIFGKDNSYMVDSIKEIDYNCIYDVKIQNASSLPDSKSGKIQTIVDLNNATQEDVLFKRPEIVRLLDLGFEEGFTDNATAAYKSAEFAIDLIISNKKAPPIQIYDDLFIHYNLVVTTLRERAYKDKLPSNVVEQIIDRCKTIEGLMFRMSMLNPMFANKLATIDHYPIFFTVPLMPQAPPAMENQMPTPQGSGEINMTPEQTAKMGGQQV